MMEMLDQGLRDEKIICVHMDDPEWNGFSDISQLQPHRLEELRRFFQDYKALENKEVLVQEFSGPAEARKTVVAAMENYRREFSGPR